MACLVSTNVESNLVKVLNEVNMMCETMRKCKTRITYVDDLLYIN